MNSVVESFYNNLIAEDRYQMILDGLQVTLIITLCAAVLGTILGGLVCWMRMNRRAWMRQIANVYIDLMRGTPVLVLLMLMYYVVMAPLDATGIFVAVITFALNTAAYISEMLRTAILGIDRGQTEAGLALGFTQRQTFFKIILPQVIRAVLPVYQGEIVSLLKGTSIVGYIAVSDMTRASDLIRSRTFDAFFPLIVTAIIYFLMAWLIGILLQSLVQGKRMKAIAAVVALVLFGGAGMLSANDEDTTAKTTNLADVPPVFKALNDKKVAVIIGSIQDIAVTDMAPNANLLRVATFTDMLAALENGKVDVVGDESLTLIFDRNLVEKFDTVNSELKPIPIGACFKLGNTELQQDFNDFLAEIRRDGTYQKIFDRWQKSEDPSNMAIPQSRGTGRVLRVATNPVMPPLNFVCQGKPSGMEPELVTEWANRRNWQLEFMIVDFAGQIPAVQTGKADVAMGSISCTEERQKQVLFSDGYVDSHIVLITRKGEGHILTNPLQTADTDEADTPWGWIVAVLIMIGGCAWLFIRRKSSHPLTPSPSCTSQAAARPLVACKARKPSADSPIIRISGMKKSYGSFDVLRDMNLDVHKGEVISIIGPSGTGKSTFLRCLNLLEQPTSGSILIDGEDILKPDANVPLLRRRMGMVFQSFNLFNGMSVLDNLCLAPMQLLGKSREEAEKRALELLQMVGLAERADAFPDQLSGGQKQRIAIARALAMDPEILLFDEPTSALDPTMVNEVLGVMTRLARQGMTMLVVTHEMRFARQVSSRVLFFADGVVYEDGTPDQLFDSPQRERTKQFIQQIHETTFIIESEYFDWFAMMSQMEQFCQQYNLSRQRTTNVLHVVDETLAILGSGGKVISPNTVLTLSYTERDDSLQLNIKSQQAISSDGFDAERDDLAVTILRNFCREINVDGNNLRIDIK